jgi:chromosome segregation protein
MKILERVRVVQFFLFEQQDLLVREITGIFGPNGSGKSSLLDAVQIAMVGANGQLLALNAQADEAAKSRSIRDYCLGKFGEGADDRVRDNAMTYITLIWRDAVNNEPLSMGVCIYAAADREGHEVRGRYILRGVELAMSDHLDLIGSQQSPRDWESFKHALIEQAKHVTGEDPLYMDAGRYIRGMLLALRGSGSAPATESFTRAFKFALRMRFNDSVDGIVRHDVLESRPTKIHKFKELTDSFRRLAEMVKRVEAQLLDGQKVDAQFSRAAEEASRAITWHALSNASGVKLAMEASEQAASAKTKAEEDLANLQAQQSRLVADQTRARSEAQRARIQREAHKAHKNYGELQEAIKLSDELARSKARELAANLNFLASLLQRGAAFAGLAVQSADLTKAASAVGKLAENPQACTQEQLERVVGPVARLAESAFSTLFHQGVNITRELAEANRELKQAHAALDRVKRGLRALDSDVQELQHELRDQGVEAMAVCDLVQITDPTWQPVIEAYLGRNVQALLVSGPQEREAFRIYRSLTGQRAIYGAKIALESRQANIRAPEPGAIAELIQGTNTAAVNYLRRQFGDIRRSQSDSEALAGARTLTQDGMLVSHADVERLRAVSAANLRIGAGSAEQIEAVRRQAQNAQSRVTVLEEQEREVQKLVSAFRQVASHETVMQSLFGHRAAVQTAMRDSRAKTELMKEAADEEYVRLGELERNWETKLAELEPQSQSLAENVGRARRNLEECEQRQANAREVVESATTQADATRRHPEHNADFYFKQWDVLREQFASSYQEMVNYCIDQKQRCEGRSNGHANSGMTGLGTFLSQYQEQISPETQADWREVRVWLSDLLKRLHDTQLIPYRDQMEDAYRTSQETFRNDVAIALSNNLDWLEETMGRLNDVLRRCPTFSNGERYRFRRVARPQLERLLKFIKNVAAFGPTDDLLGGPGVIPEEFRQLLDDKAVPGAAGASSPLDDYREFFEFDIEILREDPTTGLSKIVGHLSKRLGPGSGGEHRAPLYVIAGAALASAYRLDHGNTDGLRLMLLDEAFNKMDMGNIVATMRYLEQLGLQILLASPGENLGTLTANLHRYYDILRDPDNNTIMIEGHDVTQQTRDLFKADLPEFNPDLVAQEMALLRAAPVAPAS